MLLIFRETEVSQKRRTEETCAGSSWDSCGVAFAEGDEAHLRPHGSIDLDEEKRSVVSEGPLNYALGISGSRTLRI